MELWSVTSCYKNYARSFNLSQLNHARRIERGLVFILVLLKWCSIYCR